MAFDPFALPSILLNAASQTPQPSRGVLSDINGPSPEDDMAQVQQILQGLNAPEQGPGIAQSLLSLIPQAIAVALSPNPGQALQETLSRQQQRQDIEKERRERTKQLGAQLQIEDILARGKERRAEATQIRAEARGEARQFGAEFRANVRDVQRFNREAFQQEKMANLSFDQNKRLLDIKQGYDIENNKTQFANQKELENLRSSNNITEQKIGNELGFVLPLIYSGFFTGKEASNLYDKISKGQKLSSNEDAMISKAAKALRDEKYRHDLNVAMAHNRGTESPIAKGIEWAQNKATTNVLGIDQNGKVVELQKDMLGQYNPVDPNSKVVKYLNQQETFKYFFDYYAKTTPGLANMSGLFGQTDLPDEKALGVRLDEAITQARNERRSDAEIMQRLSDPAIQQKLGVTPQQVQEALGRNKVNPQSTEIPLTPALAEKGTSEATAVSDIQAQPGVKEATAAEIEAEIKNRLQKVGAANVVNGLIERLQNKQKALERAKTNKAFKNNIPELEHDIQDLKERLDYAYSQHPELKPVAKK